MYDHQVKKYNLVQQKAVYRWFVFSCISVGAVLMFIMLTMIWHPALPLVADMHTDNIKKIEQQVMQLQSEHDFIVTMHANNKKQRNVLEQLARSIPDEACLTEATIVPTRIVLKGNAYTHHAVADFCNALERELHMPFSIRTLERQGTFIVFEIGT